MYCVCRRTDGEEASPRALEVDSNCSRIDRKRSGVEVILKKSM